ncbi:MAG: hypothetical protein ACKO6L_07980 [Flavobacteriales bacterium]
MTDQHDQLPFFQRIDRYTRIPSSTIQNLIESDDFERFEIDQLIQLYDHLHGGWSDQNTAYLLEYWRMYHTHIFLALLEEHPRLFKEEILALRREFKQRDSGHQSMLERLNAERIVMRTERSNYYKAQKMYRYKKSRLKRLEKK